ncbi:DUF882 domain-containing protein [Rhizobium sp. SGZ-381]|uniref:DUF882 domain-containing protein n=1 Tax=Rhizobium sp. SGZ-381 TaxID=3342800 RepID=UPI00366D8EB7
MIRSFVKRAAAVFMSLALTASVMTVPAAPAAAAGETRSLKLYFVHTGERAEITFKRNGRYDPKGLQEINRFLRDWRRNEPTRMDPRLFDLVWEVYRRSGATDYIHVVSAYRSPATNGMLRSRTKGVAKSSQHMLGKAMDFFIPGVKLATLRGIAMQMQVGGVGYYPTSGSPFVHLDVGGVRAWPRMSRQELVQLFPKGNTMHVPADGKPLPGYEQAVADYKRRVSSDSIQLASTAGGSFSATRAKRQNTLAAMLFGGGADEEEDSESIAAPVVARQRNVPPVPVAAEPDEEAPVAVASAAPSAPAVGAPVPVARPELQPSPGGLATALYQPPRNPAQDALQAALPATPVMPMARPEPPGESFVDLARMNIPVPTLLGPRGLKGDAQTAGPMTASASPAQDDPMLLAAIPVPAHRPDIGRPAAAETVSLPAAAPPAVASASEQRELTPELVASLAASADYAPTPALRPERPAAAENLPAAEKPMQVASASPKPADSGAMVFNDGFDTPKPSAQSAPAKVVKGGAVTKLGGNPATPGPKVLTGNMLAQWASSTNRKEAVASIKAPRLITRALNSEYSAAYSGGFRPVSATVAVDPNRFSGANQVKP